MGLWVAASAAAQTAKSAAPAKSAAASGGTRVSAPLLTASADPRAFEYRTTRSPSSPPRNFRRLTVEDSTLRHSSTSATIRVAAIVLAPCNYFANLDIPAGAIIDYIGVNTATTVDAAMGFSLIFRDHLGGFANLASFSFPAHDGGGFATDMAGPLRHPRAGQPRPHVPSRRRAVRATELPVLRLRRGLVAPRRVRPAGNGDLRRRAHVASVLPVVEALAASGVTAGCGTGTDFCPNAPLTRGQMAVFLSKALGLHGHTEVVPQAPVSPFFLRPRFLSREEDHVDDPKSGCPARGPESGRPRWAWGSRSHRARQPSPKRSARIFRS